MNVSRTCPGPRSRSVLPLLVLPAILLASGSLRADDPAPSPRRIQTWSFEVVSGPSLGGPSSDFEAAMRRYGFDDSTHGSWFGGGTTYPYTDDELWTTTSYWGAARRRLGNGPWHVGLAGGPTEFGTVSGYRETSASGYTGAYVDARARMVTLAPMAWYEPARGLRLGAGLAIHRVDLELGSMWFSSGSEQFRSYEPGLILEAAITVPVDTPVFFVALAQYRWAADATAGPWEATSSSGGPVPFPATSVTLSHGFVAIGIGGRF